MSTRRGCGDAHDFWRSHVREFLKSDLTQRSYCHANDISYWSFNYWKRKFESELEETGIVEVPQQTIPPMTKNRHIFEIHIGDSVRIAIPPGFDPAELEKILRVMGAVL